MTFLSVPFFYLMLLLFGVFLFVPPRWRWALLLGASCGIYFLFSPTAFAIALAQMFLAYGMGFSLERFKNSWLLALCIVLQLLPLATFKYLPSFPGVNFPEDWILPLGVSFYTFQILAYLIEISRGAISCEKHLGHFALSILFFGNKVAGPIERPDFLKQSRQIFAPTPKAALGFGFLIWLGLFKKLVLADNLSFYVSPVFERPGDFHGLPVLAAILISKYQIYCDFSGYSDVAVGLAGLFGLKLTQNFNRPFATANIKTFWQRWHISLQTWIRDYLFYPLVSSPLSKLGLLSITMTTFVAFALWHEARWTFLAYGMIQGVLVYLGSRFRGLQSKSPFRKVFEFLFTYVFLISLPGVLFRAETWTQVHDIFSHLSFETRNWSDYIQIHSQSLTMMLVLILCFESLQYVQNHFDFASKFLNFPLWAKSALVVALVATLLLTANLDQEIGFLYSRF